MICLILLSKTSFVTSLYLLNNGNKKNLLSEKVQGPRKGGFLYWWVVRRKKAHGSRKGKSDFCCLPLIIQVIHSESKWKTTSKVFRVWIWKDAPVSPVGMVQTKLFRFFIFGGTSQRNDVSPREEVLTCHLCVSRDIEHLQSLESTQEG